MTGAWAVICAVETHDEEWLWAGSMANPCDEHGMTQDSVGFLSQRVHA